MIGNDPELGEQCGVIIVPRHLGRRAGRSERPGQGEEDDGPPAKQILTGSVNKLSVDDGFEYGAWNRFSGGYWLHRLNSLMSLKLRSMRTYLLLSQYLFFIFLIGFVYEQILLKTLFISYLRA